MGTRGSVLVAMSGGVDSSVAACLLAEQGYDVMGSHMNLVHLDGVEHGCCGPAARADAAEVAKVGGFDFEIVDLSNEFEASVIGDFVDEHAAGRTPNPCARCNGEIKFGAFLRRADELGMDFVATGHYVRRQIDDDGEVRLLRGADAAKDQTYMLHMLGQSQLRRSLFPVGGMPKTETRMHAERFGSAGRVQARFAGTVLRAEWRLGRLRAVAGAVVGARGRAGGRPDRHACWPSTTARSRSRWASVVGWGSRWASPRTSSTSMRRPTASSSALRSCCRVAVWSPTVCRGSRVAPPGPEPFEAQVQIRYRGDDVPAKVAPDGDRITVDVR